MTIDDDIVATEEINPHTGRADYEDRRARRIARAYNGAAKLRTEGEARLAGARRLSDMIPFGQPILVGHHSEKRHRRDLKRIRGGYDKGFEALNKATALESRARTAERNTTISSDDPNAPARIHERIAKLEAGVEKAKAANKLIRSAKGDAEKAVTLLVAAGWNEAVARKLVMPDFAGRIGFPGYTFTNSNAEIRRLKARLAQLAQNAEAQAAAEEHGDLQIGQATIRIANNRTQLLFPGKPSEAIRRELKANGFRWARSEGAWQRLHNSAAHHAAERIAKLFADEGKP